MKAKEIRLKNYGVIISNERPLVLIAGLCVLEDRKSAFYAAELLKEYAASSGLSLVFKASYDKANRSSIKAYRGPGIKEGLKILGEVKKRYSIPVLTDVHSVAEVWEAAKVADIIQIPAFLCRQTDLVCACAKTGLPVNVKKGQFLSPRDMFNVVDKIESCGNRNILLTERGSSFGYNNLVVDMRSIEIMKETGYPVIFDATHSTQQPGGLGNATAGNREMAPVLAKAAVAAGANGLFFEVHPEPTKAKSDAACIMPIDWLEDVLKTCKQIFEIVR